MRLVASMLAMALLSGQVGAQVPLNFPNAKSPEAAIYRGNIVFQHYCVLCHGVNADGKGRAAKLYQPRPADLVHTDKNADYVALIVRKGGLALGRSAFMPPWGQELTDEQIEDVVVFVGSVSAARLPAK